ncbi:MAG: hypothetical protein H0X62_13775, partial [Bacteroidetes bacterium]|nr:hypothetical protein [Bacteroidota bacterium]
MSINQLFKLIIAFSFTFSFSFSNAQVVNTWEGNQSSMWSEPLNWSEGHVPFASEIVVLDSNSVVDCIV